MGCYAEELHRAQPIKIDLYVEVDKDLATLPDELAATLNYTEIHRCLREKLSQHRWKLVECLSRDLAREVFKLSPLVRRLKMRTHKFVIAESESVAVSIDVERGEI